ncbi:hypothetical protein [Rubneribacter badeniensis]|uniref:hypothetical protein n=1 Tax=Rubneribacter badeniensis TaxID=2070688 RepID=UPI003A8DF333
MENSRLADESTRWRSATGREFVVPVPSVTLSMASSSASSENPSISRTTAST